MNSRNYTLWSVMLVVLLKKTDNKERNKRVLYDVTAAILVKQSKGNCGYVWRIKTLPAEVISIYKQKIPFVSTEKI